MSVFKYEKDSDGIVTITMDMDGPVNAMNNQYREAMGETVAKLEKEEGLAGVVLASAKSTFFAGGDLKEILSAEPEKVEEVFEGIEDTKGQLRRLEKLPIPVVAAINGAALGGGFEICLACNYRVVVDRPDAVVGLPEVQLGVLPGGGGVVRMVNLLGLQAALPYLLEGKKLRPAKALQAGLVGELVAANDDLVSAAKAWIKANPEAGAQPWDQKGFRIPGGKADSPKLQPILQAASAMLYQKTRGLMPSPEKILDTAIVAARIGFDAAMTVESRNLAYLIVTPQAKNMISTLFFQMNQINGGGSRPQNIDPIKVKKVGILGAGMMGQGIAYSSAMAGIEVVLKDISEEAAEKGKAYTEQLLAKRVAKGRMDEAKKQAVLDRIKPTAANEDLAGCDLIVEAVFENIDLKGKVTQETEPFLAEDGVFASNTSTLPITQLAEASKKPENYIGIHFFSPVDKMPAVEIICGEQTSDYALALAFDYARQIKKTAIVVNDSLGFFTSRVFGTFIDEGCRLLQEGVHPATIDRLAQAIGMPVGPLAVQDEVSQELACKVASTHRDMGVLFSKTDNSVVIGMCESLVNEYQRGGRFHGGGFYEYPADGPKHIWPKLLELYYKPELDLPVQDIKDRFLFRSVVETLRCLDEGVLKSVADGNIGSILGIGAPIWTGGYIQFVNTYGLQKFVDRCAELEATYGERFALPDMVKDKAAAGQLFE